MYEIIKQKQVDELLRKILGTFKLCKILIKPTTVQEFLWLTTAVLAIGIYSKQLAELVGEPHANVIINIIYQSLFQLKPVKKVD